MFHKNKNEIASSGTVPDYHWIQSLMLILLSQPEHVPVHQRLLDSDKVIL